MWEYIISKVLKDIANVFHCTSALCHDKGRFQRAFVAPSVWVPVWEDIWSRASPDRGASWSWVNQHPTWVRKGCCFSLLGFFFFFAVVSYRNKVDWQRTWNLTQGRSWWILREIQTPFLSIERNRLLMLIKHSLCCQGDLIKMVVCEMDIKLTRTWIWK